MEFWRILAGSGTDPFAGASEIRPRRFGTHVPAAAPGVNQLVSLGGGGGGAGECVDSKRQDKTKKNPKQNTVSHNSIADLLAWLSYKIHSCCWR